MLVLCRRPLAPNCAAHAPRPVPAVPSPQIIDLKKIESAAGGAGTRWRIIISDGQHHQQAMLATQLNANVDSKEVQLNSVVKLTNFITNMVQERKIIIVLGIEVLNTADGRIGAPISVDKAGDQAAAAAPVQQQAAPAAVPAPPQRAAAPQRHNPYAGGGGGGGGGGGAVASNDANVRFVPISALNPYQNRWTIKARVTQKSEIRRWSNQRGEGCLFSITMLDQDGGEMRATFFKDACDRFEPALEQDKCYYFSGGRLKVADRRFSSVNNQYECTFDTNADIRPAPDDGAIQNVVFSFTSIEKLEGIAPKSTVDIVGIVSHVTEASNFTSKAGKELTKRELTIVDDSGAEVKCTLWGEQATEEHDYPTQPIVAMKGCSTSDFGGVSLSTYRSTQIVWGPDVPEAHRIRAWFDGGGAAQGIKSLTGAGAGGGGPKGTFADRKTMGAIKEEGLGRGTEDGKPDFIDVKGTVTFIKSDKDGGPWYYSCPASSGAKFKVLENADGTWQCEKNQQQYNEKTNRYILPLTLTDHTGNHWCTAFDEEAKLLLDGVTADQMEEYAKTDTDKFDAAIGMACFKTCIFRLRVKEETYQDEARVKAAIVRITPISYVRLVPPLHLHAFAPMRASRAVRTRSAAHRPPLPFRSPPLHPRRSKRTAT